MITISKNNNRWLIYLILSVCLIVPFGNDEYIPALPNIAKYFGTSHVQWIMSIYLLGLSVSQLFYGPFSDRFGRKPVLLIGLAIYIVGSFLTTTANSFEILLIGRLIQAIGACSGIVTVLAIVRDAYPPEQIVKMTAFVMGIIAICPTLSPMVGNVLQLISNWRACFGLLLAFGIFYFILIMRYLEETLHEKNIHALRFKHLFFNYINLIKNKHFFGYLLTSCFSYASLFCYFAVAPFILLELLHISLIWVGLIIAINSIPLLVISYVITKFFGEFSLSKSILIGGLFILAGGALMLLINLIMKPTLLGLVIPTFVSAIGVGIIRPSASAGAIKLVDKKIAGSASALFSFFSFIGAAIFTTLTTKLDYHSMLPFGILLFVLGIAATLSALFTNATRMLAAIAINSYGQSH